MTSIPRSTRSRAAAVSVIAVLGLGGSAFAAAASPGADPASPVSSATQSQDGANETGNDPVEDSSAARDGAADRTERLSETLAPLVSDGTLTQKQADAVVATIAEAAPPQGHHQRGGPGLGMGLDVAADALGMAPAELRDALGDGDSTLADVAEAQGVETDTLIDALVTGASDDMTQRVADGSLDQEDADRMLAKLTERITTMVQDGPQHRGGFGDR